MPDNPIRPVVFDIHGRLDQSFKKVEALLQEVEAEKDTRARIAASAEMRRHIALASKTLEIAMRADAIREFQAAVLDALADADITVRTRIMGLFEARAEDSEEASYSSN